MKVYTWVEWKEKFARQAGTDKQLHHDLDCTGLVPHEEVQKLKSTLKEILDVLATLPTTEKISQFDPETKEDWLIEVPDQYKYNAFFDKIDENLERWRSILGNENRGET